ncbi:cold shock domain-containing protein [Vibrio sp. CyArs1]|uniref:cold shock domain-containing protein n=1 Tax=Vibrio TaxID=662 RepID=UPI001F05CECA|nr:cold shock domain-containing protein [Vibrio sp. CyArs1]
MEGKVKWFSNEKGYGFITANTGKDHYFNVQSVVGSSLPNNGDQVEFNSKQGNKGLRAVDVVITGKAVRQSKYASRNDDRINCPSCDKKIVPRMITYRGEPDKSVCPYCAATVKNFRSNIMGYIVLGVLVLVVLASLT